MRGKGSENVSKKRSVGITPAYAGKRGTLDSWHYADKDHPRVCGEKVADTKSTSIKLGSPPRMRGKACMPYPQRGPEGITPAYAGKSISSCANH